MFSVSFMQVDIQGQPFSCYTFAIKNCAGSDVPSRFASIRTAPVVELFLFDYLLTSARFDVGSFLEIFVLQK